MKFFCYTLISLLITSAVSRAQSPSTVSIKDGNIYISFTDGQLKQLTFNGTDSDVSLSKSKEFIVYLETIKGKSSAESSIILMDLISSQKKVLVKSSGLDGSKGSVISYANSDRYPFPGLTNVMNPILSPDDHRIYFETTAWVTVNAVHFIHLPTMTIYFFHSGSLNKVNKDETVSLNITGIQKNKGRWYQDWLFNKNGEAIMPLGRKE
ncbi:MAG: hypothetical protein HXX13_15580 [Bacteroidetes bacterium]|nr:hypothetical protein [Bacteroidota bacterium]